MFDIPRTITLHHLNDDDDFVRFEEFLDSACCDFESIVQDICYENDLDALTAYEFVSYHFFQRVFGFDIRHGF